MPSNGAVKKAMHFFVAGYHAKSCFKKFEKRNM